MLAFPHNSVMLAALLFVGLVPSRAPRRISPSRSCARRRQPRLAPLGPPSKRSKHFDGNVTLAARSLGIRRMEFFEFVRRAMAFSVITDSRNEMVDMARQVRREAVEKQQPWAVNQVIEECKEFPPPSGSPQEGPMKMALTRKAISSAEEGQEVRKRHELRLTPSSISG